MNRKNLTRMLGKLKRNTVLLFVAISVVFACALTADASGAQIQVKNENYYDANVIKFKRVEYVGQCPGTVYSPSELRARFVSDSTPTASKRRVLLKNVTEGINNDPYPYTDREYHQGKYSEGFNFSFGDQHRQQTFSVLEGQNKFEYAIRDNDTIVEAGTLTAEVSVRDLGIFPRGVICSDQEKCHDETYYDYDNDRDDRKPKRRNQHTRKVCRTVNVCSCP